jgi:GNAT superfamily N-acetyltransferase
MDTEIVALPLLHCPNRAIMGQFWSARLGPAPLCVPPPPPSPPPAPAAAAATAIEDDKFQQLTLRLATKADLDAIVRIVWASFPDDPGCNYKFPYRDQYPDDFTSWTRREYEAYLDQPDKFATWVVTAAIPSSHSLHGATGTNTASAPAERGAAEQPIAIGVWDVNVLAKSESPDRGIDERHDANRSHMRAYAAAMTRAFSNHFAHHGGQQLHLWMLMTHPDHRRRGAGTMLCDWGRDEARRRGGWALTVMASPMGRNLYEHLGYRVQGSTRARVDGEDEFVDIFAMEKADPEVACVSMCLSSPQQLRG